MGGPQPEPSAPYLLEAAPWEVALAIVGAVMLYHSLPRWMMPPLRPWNCPMCLAGLIGLALWGFHHHDLDLLVAAGLAALAAGLLTGWAPWLWRER